MNMLELNWYKSSYSSAQSDDCVEVAMVPQAVRVRDSKHKDGGYVAISPQGWETLVNFACSERPGV